MLSITMHVTAQTQLAPTVEWRVIDHQENRSTSGTYYDTGWDSGTAQWTFSPSSNQALGLAQSRAETGEEWHYGHCNFKENAQITGYVTAGYASWPNCSWDGEGCTNPANFSNPNQDELELPDHRKGESRCMVSRRSLDGHLIWTRALLPGLLRNVIQDPDGNILVVGNAYSNHWPADMQQDDNPIIRNNADESVDLNNMDCSLYNGYYAITGYVAKLDQSGKVLWCTLSSWPDLLADGWGKGSVLTDIVPVQIPGLPNIKYYAVGRTSYFGSQRAFSVCFDASGSVLTKYVYETSLHPELATNLNWPVSFSTEFISIDADPGSGKLFVTGYTEGWERPHAAIIALIDPAVDLFLPLWKHHTDENADVLNSQAGGHTWGLIQHSTGGGFATANGTTIIVWPSLANYLAGTTYGSVGNVATLLVHGMDLSGNLIWTKDLGEVRAYDLQSDMTATSDGMVAVVSSKGPPGYSEAGPHFDWSELTQPQKDCLLNTFSYDVNPSTPSIEHIHWDWETESNPDAGDNPKKYYDYWNTDAYVAKLNPADGTLLWQKQFAADDEAPACTPEDLRKQECMYKITEAPDGGLVVSGNMSANFDDYYLAKVAPSNCQSIQDYTAINALLDPNNEYHITTPTTWSSVMNVHGKIVVESSATLTINNNAVISFADSKQLDHPTQLVVALGGKLVVNGNARLTSIEQCPNSMWDGIKVLGYFTNPQDPISHSPQGMATLSNATVENSRAALLLGDASFDDPTGPMIKERTGGFTRASHVNFRNNRYDVVMRNYENRSPNDHTHILNNRSYFDQCSFVVDAGLKDGSMPLDHVYMGGVRGIGIHGCSFAGITYYDLENAIVQSAGIGVDAVNSSFLLGSKCTAVLPYGVPCPEANTVHTTFDGLSLGVHAANFQPDKTFSADQAIFTDCPRGIRMDGVVDASITRNTIDVVDFVGAYYQFATPYGIYSDQCTGYEIEDNVLTSNHPHRPQAGLVIKDSGPEANRFYNNSFDGFDYQNSTAALIEGENADPDADYLVGLQVKCNDFGQHGAQNSYDVALTGTSPSVRANQGGNNGPTDYTAPAGNRFSLLGELESDWHVADGSNYVNYFHHTGSGAWVPQDYSSYLPLVNTGVLWQSDRSLDCPDNQLSQGQHRSALQLLSATDDGLLQDSKGAYDATKDNGDTYTLLGYVKDQGNTDVQVRSALQSVAPKVSMDVWKAAFARDPAMDPWYLTEALLSNSPLEPKVMQLCYDSDLDDFYYDLVAATQSGEMNVLSRMESEISTYAGGKAEALTDMARWCWLDTTSVDSAITLLMAWQDSVKADNGPSVKAGYYIAKADTVALQVLAEMEMDSSRTPAVYDLLDRYAIAEQAAGWEEPDSTTVQWLNDLSSERWKFGSAQASAWLQALGADPLDEVIKLPDEDRSTTVRRQRHAVSNRPMLLEAYPNPSTGPVYLVCNVPPSVAKATLRIMDMNGRLIREQALANGEGIAELEPGMASPGIYLAELRLDGIRAGQVKLALQ